MIAVWNNASVRPAAAGTNRCYSGSMAAALATMMMLLASAGAAKADCAFFHESCEGTASIVANDGVTFGPLSFEPAVNSNGIHFGSGNVRYLSDQFRQTVGSISFWIRKTSADDNGGVLQIGQLGEPDTIGVFYTGQSNIVLEMRNAAGNVGQVQVGGVLSESAWTHVVAEWVYHQESSASSLVLFVNGVYAAYGYLEGTFTPTSSTLQLGRTDYYGNGECTIDEVRAFDWRLHDGEAYAEYVYSANRFVRQPTAKPPSTGPVRLVDGQLLVNGRPFRIKSVGYAPTPIGAWPNAWNLSNPAILARDLPLLRGMNVNTIRTWAQTNDSALLDACYNGGVNPIYVIMGFWVPLDGGTDYGDPVDVAVIENNFRNFIRQFKDHPAILAWGLGNENNFAYQGNVADWFALADDLAAIALEEEGDAWHPTILVNAHMLYMGDTSYGSDDASLSHVDMWGHNVYLGDSAPCYFDYYHRLTAKPFVATEYGIDAFDNRTKVEYEDVQAAWVVAQWRRIRAAGLGGSIMAYSDEWWKAGEPATQDDGGYGTWCHPDGYSNEEWWGMVRPVDNGAGPDIMQTRLVYDAMAAEYADVTGDQDGDDDVDLRDFAALQRCFAMPADAECAAFEFNVDGVIDEHDAAGFVDCLGGAGQPARCAP